ncbi:hypothetical protein M9Y10_042024 [Tritrichomonas musculus]|uniref:Uncharacterized protein n=1 Tax=Tritrichomonas musculus TaxID=1915356 RepID=A0ABR2K602_9EUKA
MHQSLPLKRKESPLDAQSSQTLRIMLKNATRELRTNFNEFYECISKTLLFDLFARECLNKNNDVNKESYEQVIKELAEINKDDATTKKKNEEEEKEDDDEKKSQLKSKLKKKNQLKVNLNLLLL